MKRYMTLFACLVALALAESSAFAQQQPPPRQPGNTPVPEKVFDWLPHEVPLKDRRIYVETEIVTQTSDHYAGTTFPYGERFGNKVGNVIPVRFRIYLLKPKEGQQEIQMQFAPLMASPPRLTIVPVANPDWQLAHPLALQPGDKPLAIETTPDVTLHWGGKSYECSQMIEVTALVQTFKDPRYRMNLWLEFTYAATNLPGGGPDWRPAETADYWVDMSDVSDPGPQLSTGDTSQVGQLRPLVPGLLLIGVGGIFLAPLVMLATKAARQRLAVVSRLDPAEELWHTLKPLLAATRLEGEEELYRFSQEQARAIVTACGAYILRTDEVNVEAWTVEEMEERQDEITDGEAWLSVFKPLKRKVVQLGKKLTPASYARIVDRIRAICPEV